MRSERCQTWPVQLNQCQSAADDGHDDDNEDDVVVDSGTADCATDRRCSCSLSEQVIVSDTA